MNPPHSIVILCAILVGLPAFGQEENPIPKGARQRNKELPQISVIDKLLSIESALGGKLNRSSELQWTKDYNKLYQRFRADCAPARIRGEGTNTACTAMALGVKACDAVMALKARNIEALKNAADQIEVLARKLGTTEGELGMANTVKIYANKGQWPNAFLALGRLQRDVLNYLRSNPEKTDQAVLVIVGGWLQGGRCVTQVIDENYDDNVSNILREQRLVKLITENMEKLSPVFLNDPLVAKIIKELPEIYKRVDVGLTQPVKQDDVRWLHNTFDDLVTKITTSEKPDEIPAVETPPSDAKATNASEGQPPLTAPAVQSPPALSQPSESLQAVTQEEKPSPQARPTSDGKSATTPNVKKPGGFTWLPIMGGLLVIALGVVIMKRRKRDC